MTRLETASAALARATDVVRAGRLATDIPECTLGADISRSRHTRMIANVLRELDCLLSILIDETALAIDPELEPRPAFGRQRNTANKLRNLHTTLRLSTPRHDRLRALGKARDCLFHCAGIVRRPDARGGNIMTVGWPGFPADGLSLRHFSLGERLVVKAVDLENVCDFYDDIASELVMGTSVMRNCGLDTAPSTPAC